LGKINSFFAINQTKVSEWIEIEFWPGTGYSVAFLKAATISTA